MGNLVVAALFLIGTHFGISSSQLRAELVQRVGERVYRLLYSLLALLAIGWLVEAWRQAPFRPLWEPGPGLAHLPLVVMPVVALLIVCSLTASNPTAIGQRLDPDAPEPATGILRVTRHPFMWGVGLWGIAHLLARGDLASLLFFGAFAVLALAGSFMIDAKRLRAAAPGWGVFLQATSNVPLVAILQRRQRLAWREIGLPRAAGALALYVLILWAHPHLFGASPFP